MTRAEQQVEIEMAAHQLVKDAKFLASAPNDQLRLIRLDLIEARGWIEAAISKTERKAA